MCERERARERKSKRAGEQHTSLKETGSLMERSARGSAAPAAAGSAGLVLQLTSLLAPAERSGVELRDGASISTRIRRWMNQKMDESENEEKRVARSTERRKKKKK